MNRFGAVLALAGVLAAGCGDKPKPAPASAAQPDNRNPLSAPTDYLGVLNKAKKSAEKTVDITVVQTAINTFKEDEGRFPADLIELLRHGYVREIPAAPYGMALAYDAAKGTVSVVKSTNAPAAK
jgi:hypothetical protein